MQLLNKLAITKLGFLTDRFGSLFVLVSIFLPLNLYIMIPSAQDDSR